MAKPDDAEAMFRQGYSCSQAVLAAFADRFDLDRETALSMAAGFGGGIGRLGETCGAVTGAIMVLGLRYGATTTDDRVGKERTYERVREFIARFKAHEGSATCRELLGCDISTDEGFQEARRRQLTTTLCPRFVREAAEILEEMLGPER